MVDEEDEVTEEVKIEYVTNFDSVNPVNVADSRQVQHLIGEEEKCDQIDIQ